MSTDREFRITDAKGGAAFTVRVVTRTTTTEIVGMQDDGALKIRLMAASAGAPEANKELVEFLAEKLGVAVNTIEIVAGEEGRDKLITVEGITTTDVEDRLGSV